MSKGATSFGVAATQAARDATKTIPIVGAAMGGDPVQLGFVASLARASRNITGLATVLSREIHGKNLELLKEAVPGVSRVAVLWNPSNPSHRVIVQEVKAAARVLRVQLQPLEARGPNEFDSAFSAMVGERADALLVVTDGIFAQHRIRLVDLAAKHRMPTMYGLVDFPEGGGLIAYGPNLLDQFRRAAYFVDKILKGAKPAEFSRLD
jgi:putative ABC transport system substrate-binding protein